MSRKSKYVRSFGKAFEIWCALVQAIFDRGGNDSDVEKLEPIAGQIADLVVGLQEPEFVGIERMEVIIRNDLTYEEKVRRGNYHDMASLELAIEDLPKPKAGSKVLFLLKLPKPMSLANIVSFGKAKGLKPAGFADAIEVGWQHPERQLADILVFLGDEFRADNESEGNYTCLSGADGEGYRQLEVTSCELRGKWPANVLYVFEKA